MLNFSQSRLAVSLWQDLVIAPFILAESEGCQSYSNLKLSYISKNSIGYKNYWHIFLRGCVVIGKSVKTPKFTFVQQLSSQNKTDRETQKLQGMFTWMKITYVQYCYSKMYNLSIRVQCLNCRLKASCWNIVQW